MSDSLLPLGHPWIWAFATCAAAAALESVCAGKGVKRRFAELSFPTPSLPLWAWSLVGVGYYAIHLVILHALLGSHPLQPYTSLALVLAAALGAVLWVVTRDVAPLYFLYLAYLPYGTWWGYAVWRRNPESRR